MAKKPKPKLHLLAAVLALFFSGAAIAGTIVANVIVFSDDSRITADDFKVGLYQTYYQDAALNSDGYIEENEKVEYAAAKDISSGGEALFAIENAIPGTWFKGGFKVDGSESKVAFNCYLTLTDLTDGSGEALFAGESKTSADYLAEQIEITVTCGDESTVFMLSEYKDISVSLGYVEAGKNAEFSVTALFTNDENNNYAINSQVKFDLHITAVQAATE